MSHATVIVAVEAGHQNELEKLVEAQMKPFDENGKFFRDGSRWDYWGIYHSQRRKTVTADQEPMPAGCAFLVDRRWHEGQRVGWFGGVAQTECEVARGEDFKGKCIFGDIKAPPCIISWGEDRNIWVAKFWSRFIAPLSPETWVVWVDYHV